MCIIISKAEAFEDKRVNKGYPVYKLNSQLAFTVFEIEKFT